MIQKKALEIGTLMSGQKFTLPLDLVTRTLGIIGIRGWGKTVAATVIAEEMCEAGLPWVAIDPVGVWWGLRANPDGTPGGYPVVILGGEHGDLPLEKSAGARVAEAILQEHVSCVIDMSSESKTTVRHFVAEFCDRLMELRPEVPRHIFIEEAPELVPQKPMGEQKRSLAAVDRLIRLGRNRGYGATLISQRTATIQKDVLTQCECLLFGRSIGKPDRDAAKDWIAEVVGTTESEAKAAKLIDSLTKLDSGTGWFWSPQWLDVFSQIRIRRRKTYHPGETRTVGQAIKQVQLSDVREFVDLFGKAMQSETKALPSRRESSSIKESNPIVPDHRDERIAALITENGALRTQVTQLSGSIARLRQQLEPQYRSLQALFGDLQTTDVAGGSSPADTAVWETWKQKLGKGAGRVIDILCERGELTRVQLKTLAGYSRQNMANIISVLNSNQLIEKEGDKIRLRHP